LILQKAGAPGPAFGIHLFVAEYLAKYTSVVRSQNELEGHFQILLIQFGVGEGRHAGETFLTEDEPGRG
jgi:hypothetical protein